jgi:Icc-related predicted phosphoesterase
MKILVLSDLHLTAHTFPAEIGGNRLDAQADVVVLAGDIDDGLGGIRWARETFPDTPIVMVAGNHEFFDKHWFRQVDDMRAAANKIDVDFLEADEIHIAGVRFLGCTLWTDFELFGTNKKEIAMRVAKAQMNDYQCINVSRYAEFHWVHSKHLMPELTVLRHKGSVEWLAQKLAKGDDPKKTVVVTHHAPHPNSVPARFQKDMLSAAYSSDLTRLMGKSGLWIHGHTHHSADYNVNGTRIVANPRGYLFKNGGFENSDFNPTLIVEV